MRERTCCFTGHRDLQPDCREEIAEKLEETIARLVQDGIQVYKTGGALGFDTLAAQTVLRIKEKHPQIKLSLVLPCLTQTRGWTEADVKEYERIRERADEVVYTSREYVRGCMFKRNRSLVDNSSICVCWLTRSTGGTAYTVKYAIKQGLKIINLFSPQTAQNQSNLL